MSCMTKRIESSKKEIRRLKDEIVDFVRLREDYLSGRRNMYADYPKWRHPFHRTPMDWVNYRIQSATYSLEMEEKKLRLLYKEREWYECPYYRTLNESSINEIINKDGYIMGIKL